LASSSARRAWTRDFAVVHRVDPAGRELQISAAGGVRAPPPSGSTESRLQAFCKQQASAPM
jgi:hypothetical protein